MIPLLHFDQLRMLFPLDLLLLPEYIPPSVFDHFHVAVLDSEGFFNLPGFCEFFGVVFTHKTLSVLIILLPDLGQLEITVDVFLWVLTILWSKDFDFHLKFDFMEVFHEFSHFLFVLHQESEVSL